MKEISHNNLEYQGAPGEKVTISITPSGTSHLVTFTLDGTSDALTPGDPIEFNLKGASGQQTVLQIIFDFNGQGSYEVAVNNVSNCSQDTAHVGKCINTVDGPPKAFLTFVFSVA